VHVSRADALASLDGASFEGALPFPPPEGLRVVLGQFSATNCSCRLWPTTMQDAVPWELASKTVGGQATSYTYDALGNLLHVTLPSGENIDYIVDGENRRVGKKVNGTVTGAFVYQDALKVVAQLDGGGNIVARFVFGSRSNVRSSLSIFNWTDSGSGTAIEVAK